MPLAYTGSIFPTACSIHTHRPQKAVMWVLSPVPNGCLKVLVQEPQVNHTTPKVCLDIPALFSFSSFSLPLKDGNQCRRVALKY